MYSRFARVLPKTGAVYVAGLLYANHRIKEAEKPAEGFFWLLGGGKKKKSNNKKKKGGASDTGGSDFSDAGKKLKIKELNAQMIMRNDIVATSGKKVRKKVIISEEDMVNIIHLVNELVDLDFFDEESEERIFDDCIRRIVLTLEEIMPEDFHLLVNSTHPLGLGISEAHAKMIEKRAIAYVRALLAFPYLDTVDETRIITFVTKIICQAMRADRSLEMLRDKQAAG